MYVSVYSRLRLKYREIRLKIDGWTYIDTPNKLKPGARVRREKCLGIFSLHFAIRQMEKSNFEMYLFNRRLLI